MIFSATKIKGAYIISLEKLEDERGFFARTWDKKKIEEYNLNSEIIQCNISFNKEKGTLRGLHYQTKPYEEAKLVRCTNGEVFEVMIDLRKESSSYLSWDGFSVNSKDYKMLYVPEGCAFGFQTLQDNTEIYYQISNEYKPENAEGIRWNDPYFKIEWPLDITIISEKDREYKSFLE